MKKIAFTFGGRESHMTSQKLFMEKLIHDNVIDEWHIWDFSRKDSDQAWLISNFGENRIYITPPDSVDYTTVIPENNLSANIKLIAQNDAEILIKLTDHFYIKLNIGTNCNEKTIIEHNLLGDRRILTLEKALLEWNNINHISINIKQYELKIHINDLMVFNTNLTQDISIENFNLSTRRGTYGFWEFSSNPHNPIKLITSNKKGYEGFYQTYRVYALDYFSKTSFIKIDDDIVFCDTSQISNFLNFAKENHPNDILSANVINNGVCAHYQQKNNYLTNLDIEFEYPSEGTCGSLWESSDKCSDLHNFFLDNYSSILSKSLSTEEVIIPLPHFDRFSINFITFQQSLLLKLIAIFHMYPGTKDDEELMTQALPMHFGTRKFIYNPLVVSHLSFYKQDPGMNIDKISNQYLQLNKKFL